MEEETKKGSQTELTAEDMPAEEVKTAKKGKSKEVKTDYPLFWGPYLAERKWATVREQVTTDGEDWSQMTHEDAAKQVYRWDEDGLMGVCDRHGLLCASLALWNSSDSKLKERLFGLTADEGDHGFDVKELYYYLDNTPDHSYMRALYKYTRQEFPYETIRFHAQHNEEFKLLDNYQEYFDVEVVYAKPSNVHLICQYTVTNQALRPSTIHIIPQFVLRNVEKPKREFITRFSALSEKVVRCQYDLGTYVLLFNHSSNVTFNKLMFTKNFYSSSLIGSSIRSCLCKDSFSEYIVGGDKLAVSFDSGTKCGAWMSCELPAKTSAKFYWELKPFDDGICSFEDHISYLDAEITKALMGALTFYAHVIPRGIPSDYTTLCQLAIAGLLWNKQLYMFSGRQAIKELTSSYGEDIVQTPVGKKYAKWEHLACNDVLIVPDKWEYPWFETWDTVLRSVIMAVFDLPFAKQQIQIFLSKAYMHPNGQIPGSESTNYQEPAPPLFAWAVCKIYEYEKAWNIKFIEATYEGLCINYQWWMKRDLTRSHLFGRCNLGMDNISVFNRSNPPKGIFSIKQADASGWVGLFALNMLQLTLTHCRHSFCLTDMAIRFLSDFLHIAKAINAENSHGGLWSAEDSFYYDIVHFNKKGKCEPIRVRSWTGLVPLFACGRINLKYTPAVKGYLMNMSHEFSPYVSSLGDDSFFLSLVPYRRLDKILQKVFSVDEFLSPFGIRSLSKYYEDNPYTFRFRGQSYTISYEPGESSQKDNRNWRGPIWLDMNFFLVECLTQYAELKNVFTNPLTTAFAGDDYRKTFGYVVFDLCNRCIALHKKDGLGHRPVNGGENKYLLDDWMDLSLFYEYYHADTGRGCGASHVSSCLYLMFIRKIVAKGKGKK